MEATPRFTAGLGRGIGEVRADVALPLESVERHVNRPAREGHAPVLLDFLANRYRIGAITYPQDGQQDELFDFSKQLPVAHMAYCLLSRQLDEGEVKKVGRALGCEAFYHLPLTIYHSSVPTQEYRCSVSQ